MIQEGNIIGWIDEELEFMLPTLERISESTFLLHFFPWVAKDYLRVVKSLHILKGLISSGAFSATD